MGYYTRYEVEIKPDSNEIREAIEENEYMNYAFDGNECKWYEHEGDMKELSRQFPDALFKLTGEGEEAGDLWHKYFKNGKMQSCYAKIVYDEFDESKLK
jgi:hypothetical protein